MGDTPVKYLDLDGLSYYNEKNKNYIDHNFKDALLKIEQDLTQEEIEQVRINLHNVGRYATGLTYTPYEVVETGLNTSEHTITETPLDPVVAAEGAEIYNDYVGNIATGAYAIATGYKTQATGPYARSNGWWTTAGGQCANAEGLLSVASGHFSHAEGTRTKATTNNAHSEGDMTTASGRQSHAEGQKTVASGFCSHAEGSGSQATNYYSHAEGLGTIAGGKNQTAMGKYNIKDTSSLLIVGNGTSDTNRKNVALINSTEAWFAGDVYVGSAGGLTKDSGSVKLSREGHTHLISDITNLSIPQNLIDGSSNGATRGINTLSEDESYVMGTNAFAIGNGTKASGKNSFASGQQTEATGSYSHTEGYATFATAAASHAEGYDTHATARYAHAEGASTTASGNNSHAEGNSTTSSGHYSHAEGNFTVAAGGYSHAEGNYAQTGEDGNYAHAEGSYTKATKVGAHAEGNYAEANGVFAHVEGYYTKANSMYQHVRGKYNEVDDNNVYATIIGNGTSENDRKNIHTLDWSGNAEYAGDVVANGCGGSNPISLVGLNSTVGSDTLLTDAKTIIGAINELYSLYKSIVEITTEQIDGLVDQ